ncbi:unnamed protein product [Lactuca saligna]|uniref:Ubiquitin-like protease family profile domain-containing protein n=1 Tax=Lactuca saligna TaxID=75948 RepID=A0AA36ER55_LACSI|nr:unnamed protein product [Lactuca saligna]
MMNDADKNKKEGEIGVKEKDGKRNENENDEEEKDDHDEETNNHEVTIQQTENENLLDNVVHNIVDNVLGIGISSLNSQEDEIWNHPEMKTIFDNIDIGKEKSEDRNEGGTEAKNTKDGGEEKHIETEKRNAKDKVLYLSGKKKSKNDNKKGEKTDKTKGNKGDTHPNFSLGLSQDLDQTSSKKSNESSPKKTTYKETNQRQPSEGLSKHDLDQPREKKLADAFKSPFKCKKKKIDTKPKLTHQESITTYLTSTLSDERKYEKFKKNFHESTNGYKKILNIKDIDMKPSIEILDNSAVEGDYEGKYGVILKPLKIFFVRYFKEINQPRENAISKESIKPQRFEMSWRTVKNKVDCGVFAMRHIETYMGQPLSKWKPVFHKESSVQQTTLEKLRQRYAHIMLTSEINMLKAKVLDLAEKYQKVEFKVRTDHAYKAMQTIQKRLKE